MHKDLGRKEGRKDSRARRSKVQTARLERAGQSTLEWVVPVLTLRQFLHLQNADNSNIYEARELVSVFRETEPIACI